MLFDPDPPSNSSTDTSGTLNLLLSLLMQWGNSSTDTSAFQNLLLYYLNQCSILRANGKVFQTFVFTNILLVLLLSTLVFLVAAQRWMKQRRTSSEAANNRQSDAFTFNMVAMEMAGVIVNSSFLAFHFNDLAYYTFFSKLFYIISCVKVQFLLLTCVEFYLAVVHPVIYLRLKSSGGVWIRGISAAVVWLLCVLCGVVSHQCTDMVTIVLCLCLLVLDLAVVSFCCISVLWTLKRPGPGENAEDKVDPSKQRAFQTILKIMLVIWLCLLGMLVFFGMEVKPIKKCFSTVFTYWLTLPSTLLLPLLFFQRAGKLSCCKK